MKHRGEIVEKVFRESGITITELADKIGYSRGYVYTLFDNAQLSLDLIVQIGKAIKHDFRKEFPELFIQDPNDMVSESTAEYSTPLKECIKEKEEWKDKYYNLLEEHNNLLRNQIKK